jgi:hypothetical protein
VQGTGSFGHFRRCCSAGTPSPKCWRAAIPSWAWRSSPHRRGVGSTASKLGALNAAHASDTALANAAPNSRVGKIAAYKEAEIAAKAAEADAAAADQVVADAQEAPDSALAANADGDPLNDVDQATIDGLTQVVADVEADAATADASAQAAQDEADAALVNATNKDITDDDGNVLTDVRDAVNDLLGIDWSHSSLE